MTAADVQSRRASESIPTVGVNKQHVVSQTLLRQWCVNGMLSVYDMRAAGRPAI